MCRDDGARGTPYAFFLGRALPADEDGVHGTPYEMNSLWQWIGRPVAADEK
jgi:hypothetical protein